MKTKIYLLLFTSLLLSNCSLTTSDEISVISPDGNIKIMVKVDTLANLTYEVKLKGNTVVKPSQLGIALADPEMDFTKKLVITKEKEEEIDETYTMISGKRSKCRNHANEKTLTFKNTYNEKVNIVFRAYNDGIAYRYELFNDEPDTVLTETSTFRIDSNSISWIQEYLIDNENFYKKRHISELNNPKAAENDENRHWMGGTGKSEELSYLCPGLFQTSDNQWILASDAAVFDNYAALQLKHKGNGEMQFHIPHQIYYARPWYKGTWEEVVMKEDNLVEATPNLATPWRALIIGDELADIVESNLIENLNPPAEIGNSDWIDPGVAVFPWWGNSIANDDPEIMKDYIDMCAEMNWEWLEFDIGLIGNNGGYAANYWRDIEYIQEVIDYANEKGIKVYGWDERKYLDTPEKRADIFGTYQKMGVQGIKIDFLNSDKQEAMKFRADALRDAAKYNLHVSFHGEITPRGMRRTFPNMMTQEGVRGAEYYKFAPDNGVPTPKHNCTLPFTRNVVGPMDYTPTSFSTPRRSSTYVHELALPIIFESGWTCMADKPEEFLNCPAKELLQKLNSTWDEIKFIEGYPGEYCAIARRSGSNWFVAGINAGPQRWVHVDFDFIKEGEYKIIAYRDNINKDKPDKLFYDVLRVSKGDHIRFLLEENGGFAFVIENSF